MDFKRKGVQYINSNDIANSLNLNNEMVRKDIFAFSSKNGVPNKGRNIDQLILDIKNCLGYGSINNALLIGVGSLGKALLNYIGFEHYNLNIVAAFDSNKDMIGKTINNVKVYDIDELKEVKRLKKASIGIICVPKSEAQGVAVKLVASGVEAIWNFAPTKLDLNDDIIVSNMDMAESLADLAHRLYIKNIKKEK